MDGTKIRTGLVLGVSLLVAACGGSAGAAASAAPAATAPAQPNKDSGEAAGPTILTLAHGEDGSTETEAFVAAVRAASGGAIEIAVDYGWGDSAANYESSIIEDVRAGKADLGVTGARAFDLVGIDSFRALMAPMLVDSDALARAVLEGEPGVAMLDGLQASDLFGVGYLRWNLRRPLTYGDPLLSPVDYAGKTFGYRASAVSQAALEALGANPTVPPLGNLRDLDATEGSLAIARDYAAHGVRGITGNVVLWPRTDILFGNAATMAALTADQRTILREAAATAFAESASWERGQDQEALDTLCNVDMRFDTASEADIAALRTAFQPVYASLEQDAATKSAIEAIRAMRVDGPPQAVAPCAKAPASEVPVAVTPIDGTWTTKYTLEEFRNTPGVDRGELANNGGGEFELKLDRGKLVQSYLGPGSPDSGSGTYTVDGNHVEFVFTEGAGAGEDFQLLWSLFDNTLTFERDPAGESPTPYVVKPWTKTN